MKNTMDNVNYWLLVYKLANQPVPSMLRAAPNTSTPKR